MGSTRQRCAGRVWHLADQEGCFQGVQRDSFGRCTFALPGLSRQGGAISAKSLTIFAEGVMVQLQLGKAALPLRNWNIKRGPWRDAVPHVVLYRVQLFVQRFCRCARSMLISVKLEGEPPLWVSSLMALIENVVQL